MGFLSERCCLTRVGKKNSLDSGDSNTVSNGVIIGNNSCVVSSGERVDVVALGNDIGTATGSRSIVVGNRVCALPSAISSLGASNLIMGHDVEIRNSSLSNIIFGNSAKVCGNASIAWRKNI